MNNADATISADTTTAAASGSDSDTLRRNGFSAAAAPGSGPPDFSRRKAEALPAAR